MNSIVSICNLALSRIGHRPIQTVNGTDPASAHCARLYDNIRRSVIRAHTWNFALKTSSLAKLDEVPADYSYAFQLPSDCLRPIKLVSSSGDLEFMVRGQAVYTDETEAVLEYVEDVEDPNRFDSQFIDAFAYRLAVDLASALSAKDGLARTMTDLYEREMARARSTDAREPRKETLSDNPYVDARN